MLTRRTFVKKSSFAAGIAAMSGIAGCFDEKNHKENAMEMKFSDLIEARRSVRKYAKAEISKDAMAKIVKDALIAPSWKTETTRYCAAIWDGAKAKVKSIFGIPAKEILMSVIAVGKSAQPYFKNPRKPVAEVLKAV